MRNLPPIYALVAAALWATSPTSVNYARAEDGAIFKIGTTVRHVFPDEPYDWRGAGSHALLEAVWYPAADSADPKLQRIPPVGEAIFEAAPAAPEAPIAANPAKFPLILLSHGTGGTVQTLAWLATALASRGYIVAGVNHPGNNATEPYTVQGFVQWWLRAEDVSATLDDMVADPGFGPRIDTQKIGAAGFSLGGYTMMELAGGRTSREHFGEVCRAAPDQISCKAPPEFHDLAAKGEALAATDPVFARALHKAGESYRDPRIHAAFAIAPALGPAFTPESLNAIAIPLAIVAGAGDSIVPVDANAKYYAANIPQAELTIFPGAVDHYTFLDGCTAAGHAAQPAICSDRPGVDREAVHNQAIDIAIKFFAGHL
jgi:predicted dienelactone hydrolase